MRAINLRALLELRPPDDADAADADAADAKTASFTSSNVASGGLPYGREGLRGGSEAVRKRRIRSLSGFGTN